MRALHPVQPAVDSDAFNYCFLVPVRLLKDSLLLRQGFLSYVRYLEILKANIPEHRETLLL